MSLGVKSVWRAHAWASAASGLSLSPRELPRALSFYAGNRHIYTGSTTAANPTESSLKTGTIELNLPNETNEPANTVRRVTSKSPAEPDLDLTNSGDLKVINASPSAVRRAFLRRVIKQRAGSDSKNPVLVKQVQWYPSKDEVARSVRKSSRSKARQDLWAYARSKEDRPGADWRGVVSFLSKLTPKFGSIFDFKVTVGKGAADEIRELLPRGPTAEPGQLQQATRAIVRVDGVDDRDGTLHLTLTGSAHSIRMALMDLLEASGHITAVRTLDSNSEGMLRDLWQQQRTNLLSVKLLGSEDVEFDDKVLTLTSERGPVDYRLPERRHYTLVQRADQIPQPAVWTRSSIESYVALLVYGVVPPHHYNTLYNKTSDHQQTVVALLLEIFLSEDSRRVLTPKALAMALMYIQSRKLAFRPAARAIFNQAEVHNIPMDTRICNLFMQGSASSGDLDGFDAILKTMARKNLHADSESWLALLSLVEDVEAKRYILGKMHKKGLDRIESALVKAGRHMAPFELQNSLKQLESISAFVNQQDKLYGSLWLDQSAFNKLVDVLGKNGKHDLCNELFELVYETRRALPNAITLNTMITHNRSLQQALETIRMFQTRWPTAKVLDKDSYDILFQVAWKNRSPNMLRVIWHYASFARLASSKMRHRVTSFLRKDEGLGRMSLVKTWEAEIVGGDTMALLSPNHEYTLATAISWWHGAKSHYYKPAASFGKKLIEAYELDRQVHSKIKEGEVMTPPLRASLTVKIPLKQRDNKELLLVAPPGRKRNMVRSDLLEEGSEVYYE